jgi:hypothetical protein
LEISVDPVSSRTEPGRGRVRRGQRRLHGAEPAGEVDAVIGVADRGIELGEVISLCFDDRCDLRDPCAEEFSVHKGSSR